MEILGESIEGNSMGSEQTIDNCKTCQWFDEQKVKSLAAQYKSDVIDSLKQAEFEHINRFHFGEKKR